VERDALPPGRRVPINEAVAWQEMIEQKIRASFDHDTLVRYQVAWNKYRQELDQDKGVEYSRALSAWNRIVAFLEELDS
jgi:hypothetical protein